MTKTQAAAPKYSGADWVEEAFKVKCSPLGRKVADLLGQVYQGIYHLNQQTLKKADWASEQYVALRADSGYMTQLATWDFNYLTNLVVMAHDFCLRLDVSACRIPPDLWSDEKATAMAALKIINDKNFKEKDWGYVGDIRRALTDRRLNDREKLAAARLCIHHAPDMGERVRLLEVLDPRDDQEPARRAWNAIYEIGQDPDEILSRPGLVFAFTPRAGREGSMMARHPSMEEAVARARSLAQPIWEHHVP